ncbi:hemerythrin domain-containing protein [Ideonella sp. DXS29W]|uniref:Hemerythrin domain-containing protein n=1 Tax=Ideonella lacteola TaxID=2984193 RepID=A0ABU9BUV3_9BURK
MASTLSLHAAPAAGLDQPFELLAACHDRVRRSLDLLSRLVDHVEQHGADAPAAEAARDVLRYFSVAAPLHHEDEERHLLPLLRASEQAPLREVAEQMAADHRAFRALWGGLAAALQQVVDQHTPDEPALRRQAQAFIALHDSHLTMEDRIAFPAAERLAQEWQRHAMSADMATRRGVPPPEGQASV